MGSAGGGAVVTGVAALTGREREVLAELGVQDRTQAALLAVGAQERRRWCCL
jgi:hypothetical protein